MSDHEHFQKLQHIYSIMPNNQYYSPAITVSKGEAEIVIPVREKLFHNAGTVHGSVYFKILDDAAIFAVQSVVKKVGVLTVSFTVQLFRPVMEGEMRAVGKIAHRAKDLFVAESFLYNNDQLAARGMGNITKSKIPLGPEMGYK